MRILICHSCLFGGKSYSSSIILPYSGDSEGVYQLELDLISVHFSHHPLYSVEHVLASRLQQACQQHATKIANKSIDYHSERVSAKAKGHVPVREFNYTISNRSKHSRPQSLS